MATKYIIALYFVITNIVGFIIFALDKRKAIKDQFRIPEANLFLVAIMGGSLGCLLGMRVWHHKTRKLKFVIGMPLVLVVQILLGLFITHNKIFQLIIL